MTAAAGQVALFEDGALVATSEDTAAEEIVHLAVLQRARLDSVLVLGFGSGNEVGQLLAHQPAAIDWVVVDAEIVHWLAAYLPDEVGRALASPTVHLIEADPRAWLAKSARYDLILSSPVVYADPSLDITQLILDQLRLEYEADLRERSLR